MAIVHRPSLFTWQSVESRSDLDRLRLVLGSLADEELMVKLERQRGRGRDDYPVRAMWNSVLAGIVFEHESIESLRRELSRNGELRDVCGFDPLGGAETVPSADAYSRFLKTLMQEQESIETMFDGLVAQLKELLPDLGRHLAVDSKALQSHARGRKEPAASSDPEADWGIKKKQGRRAMLEGTLQRLPVWHFGASAILAEAYRLQGDLLAAIQLLEEASKKSPLLFGGLGSAAGWLRNKSQLADFYRDEGRYEDARKIEDELRRLLALADSDHPILRQLDRTQDLALREAAN